MNTLPVSAASFSSLFFLGPPSLPSPPSSLLGAYWRLLKQRSRKEVYSKTRSSSDRVLNWSGS